MKERAYFKIGAAAVLTAVLGGCRVQAKTRQAASPSPGASRSVQVATPSPGETRSAADYQKAVAAHPRNAQAYYDWGRLLWRRRDYKGAIDKYRKAVEADPRYAVGYGNLGATLQHEGDREGALAAYQKAIELDPHGSIAKAARSRMAAMGYHYADAAR